MCTFDKLHKQCTRTHEVGTFHLLTDTEINALHGINTKTLLLIVKLWV
jgi:hypothetical protein